VLQLGQPGDHLATVEPVGAARVRLAGALGEGLGLAAAPLQAEAVGDPDAVDEQRLVAVETWQLKTLDEASTLFVDLEPVISRCASGAAMPSARASGRTAVISPSSSVGPTPRSDPISGAR
jgi:hypothetical protein